MRADAAGRIQASVSKAQTGMIVGLLIGFILSSVAAYLVVQSVDRPLARVLAAMGVMRLGDYSQKLVAQDGEFGVLASGFNLLTDSLQEIAKNTEQVAGGDLTVQVKRLSQKDIMGNALAEMVEKLSSLIRRVQKSGLQVNTSATEIAATAQEQLSTASEVAATTSEIGATSKQISATSRELAETIKGISEVAEKRSEEHTSE